MRFLLLAGFSFLFMPVHSQKKLLIIGSSTSTCYFGPSSFDNCYVTRLQKLYADKGQPFLLDNRAVAGDNCYHGMPLDFAPPTGRNAPRPYYNITEGLAANPDVVLVNYPSNGYDTYSVEEVMFCLRTIRKTVNNAGKPCYITTTQPRNYPGEDARRKMAELKERILLEFGTYAIDFWTELANPVNK
ncbi:MAG: SGNH/GDSL hydrolase family protein, partial [Chitinophagaceae bacterium]